MTNLFDDFTDSPPIARTTDPETSHVAAENITNSGTRARHAAKILAAIVANPGSTCGELAELTGLHRSAVSKRLPDLNKAARIFTTGASGARVCKVQKTRQLVWYTTGANTQTEAKSHE